MFAGIQVSSSGYTLDPSRLNTIKKFPRPKTSKQLQRWVGLCMSLSQFASSPLKDRLHLQSFILMKKRLNKITWNPGQIKEFETARKLLSDTSQMIKPFNLEPVLGLVVDTAKTTCIGYILFQFDPLSPPGKPMNFAT